MHKSRKLSRLVALFVGLAVFASGQCTVRASGLTQIVSYSGAPARITYCEANPSYPQWELGVDFNATGETDLTAVQVTFDIQDSFGTSIGKQVVEAKGDFSPDIRIERARGNGWTVGASHMPATADTGRIVCSITKTLNSNGDIWSASGAARVAEMPQIPDGPWDKTWDGDHPAHCIVSQMLGPVWGRWDIPSCRKAREKWAQLAIPNPNP